MADNWLEKHREDYESRKAAWIKKRRHWTPKPSPMQPPAPSTSQDD